MDILVIHINFTLLYNDKKTFLHLLPIGSSNYAKRRKYEPNYSNFDY